MPRYRAYGLTLDSDLPLPELPSAEGHPDIAIRKGRIRSQKWQLTDIPRQGIEAEFAGSEREAYLRWEGVAIFSAREGQTLVVEPASENVSPELLNLYVLSEALGLILYQRGLFLLHASAVQVGNKAVIFAGAPGAGKSTIAAAFHQAGYPVIADDMVAVGLGEEESGLPRSPCVYPGFPQVKIWQPSVEGLGLTSKLQPLFPGSQKFVIREVVNFPSDPLPLAHIIIIEPGDKLQLTPMKGKIAFISLTRFFPIPPQLLQSVALEKHMQQCLSVSSQVPMWKLENPKSFAEIQKFVVDLGREMTENA